MNDKTETAILEFLDLETIQGRIESTMREITKGTSLAYSNVGRTLERLLMKDQVSFRERGTERKTVRYYYLKDIPSLYQEKHMRGKK